MSGINPEHLNYFKFIGRIMGLAIYHNQYLSTNFTLLFYKKLLNKSFEPSDIKYIDPEIYKNIKWLLYVMKLINLPFLLLLVLLLLSKKTCILILFFRNFL